MPVFKLNSKKRGTEEKIKNKIIQNMPADNNASGFADLSIFKESNHPELSSLSYYVPDETIDNTEVLELINRINSDADHVINLYDECNKKLKKSRFFAESKNKRKTKNLTNLYSQFQEKFVEYNDAIKSLNDVYNSYNEFLLKISELNRNISDFAFELQGNLGANNLTKKQINRLDHLHKQYLYCEANFNNIVSVNNQWFDYVTDSLSPELDEIIKNLTNEIDIVNTFIDDGEFKKNSEQQSKKTSNNSDGNKELSLDYTNTNLGDLSDFFGYDLSEKTLNKNQLVKIKTLHEYFDKEKKIIYESYNKLSEIDIKTKNNFKENEFAEFFNFFGSFINDFYYSFNVFFEEKNNVCDLLIIYFNRVIDRINIVKKNYKIYQDFLFYSYDYISSSLDKVTDNEVNERKNLLSRIKNLKTTLVENLNFFELYRQEFNGNLQTLVDFKNEINNSTFNIRSNADNFRNVYEKLSKLFNSFNSKVSTIQIDFKNYLDWLDATYNVVNSCISSLDENIRIISRNKLDNSNDLVLNLNNLESLYSKVKENLEKFDYFYNYMVKFYGVIKSDREEFKKSNDKIVSDISIEKNNIEKYLSFINKNLSLIYNKTLDVKKSFDEYSDNHGHFITDLSGLIEEIIFYYPELKSKVNIDFTYRDIDLSDDSFPTISIDNIMNNGDANNLRNENFNKIKDYKLPSYSTSFSLPANFLNTFESGIGSKYADFVTDKDKNYDLNKLADIALSKQKNFNDTLGQRSLSLNNFSSILRNEFDKKIYAVTDSNRNMWETVKKNTKAAIDAISLNQKLDAEKIDEIESKSNFYFNDIFSNVGYVTNVTDKLKRSLILCDRRIASLNNVLKRQHQQNNNELKKLFDQKRELEVKLNNSNSARFDENEKLKFAHDKLTNRIFQLENSFQNTTDTISDSLRKANDDRKRLLDLIKKEHRNNEEIANALKKETLTNKKLLSNINELSSSKIYNLELADEEIVKKFNKAISECDSRINILNNNLSNYKKLVDSNIIGLKKEKNKLAAILEESENKNLININDIKNSYNDLVDYISCLSYSLDSQVTSTENAVKHIEKFKEQLKFALSKQHADYLKLEKFNRKIIGFIGDQNLKNKRFGVMLEQCVTDCELNIDKLNKNLADYKENIDNDIRLIKDEKNLLEKKLSEHKDITQTDYLTISNAYNDLNNQLIEVVESLKKQKEFTKTSVLKLERDKQILQNIIKNEKFKNESEFKEFSNLTNQFCEKINNLNKLINNQKQTAKEEVNLLTQNIKELHFDQSELFNLLAKQEQISKTENKKIADELKNLKQKIEKCLIVRQEESSKNIQELNVEVSDINKIQSELVDAVYYCINSIGKVQKNNENQKKLFFTTAKLRSMITKLDDDLRKSNLKNNSQFEFGFNNFYELLNELKDKEEKLEALQKEFKLNVKNRFEKIITDISSLNINAKNSNERINEFTKYFQENEHIFAEFDGKYKEIKNKIEVCEKNLEKTVAEQNEIQISIAKSVQDDFYLQLEKLKNEIDLGLNEIINVNKVQNDKFNSFKQEFSKITEKQEQKDINNTKLNEDLKNKIASLSLNLAELKKANKVTNNFVSKSVSEKVGKAELENILQNYFLDYDTNVNKIISDKESKIAVSLEKINELLKKHESDFISKKIEIETDLSSLFTYKEVANEEIKNIKSSIDKFLNENSENDKNIDKKISNLSNYVHKVEKQLSDYINNVNVVTENSLENLNLNFKESENNILNVLKDLKISFDKKIEKNVQDKILQIQNRVKSILDNNIFNKKLNEKNNAEIREQIKTIQSQLACYSEDIGNDNLEKINQVNDQVKKLEDHVDSVFNQLKSSTETSFKDLNENRINKLENSVVALKELTKSENNKLTSFINNIKSELAIYSEQIGNANFDDINKLKENVKNLEKQLASYSEQIGNDNLEKINQVNDQVKKLEDHVDSVFNQLKSSTETSFKDLNENRINKLENLLAALKELTKSENNKLTSFINNIKSELAIYSEQIGNANFDDINKLKENVKNLEKQLASYSEQIGNDNLEKINQVNDQVKKLEDHVDSVFNQLKSSTETSFKDLNENRINKLENSVVALKELTKSENNKLTSFINNIKSELAIYSEQIGNANFDDINKLKENVKNLEKQLAGYTEDIGNASFKKIEKVNSDVKTLRESFIKQNQNIVKSLEDFEKDNNRNFADIVNSVKLIESRLDNRDYKTNEELNKKIYYLTNYVKNLEEKLFILSDSKLIEKKENIDDLIKSLEERIFAKLNNNKTSPGIDEKLEYLNYSIDELKKEKNLISFENEHKNLLNIIENLKNKLEDQEKVIQDMKKSRHKDHEKRIDELSKMVENLKSINDKNHELNDSKKVRNLLIEHSKRFNPDFMFFLQETKKDLEHNVGIIKQIERKLDDIKRKIN